MTTSVHDKVWQGVSLQEVATPDLTKRRSADSEAEEAEPAPLRGASRATLRVQRHLFVSWTVLTDAVALTAAFYMAYWIRYDLGITVAPEVVPNPSAYQGLAAFLVPGWLLSFFVFDLYDSRAMYGGAQESSKGFNACTTATMFVVLATFLLPEFVISRMWLVAVWLLSSVFLAANRFVKRRLMYAFRDRGHLLSPTLIVGSNEEAESLSNFLSEQRASGVRLLGVVRPSQQSSNRVTQLPNLGTLAEIQTLVRKHDVEDIIVAITAVDRAQLLELCESLDQLPVRLQLSSGLYELLTTRVRIHAVAGVPLISLEKNRLHRSEAALKTVLDSSLALAGLLFLAPLLLAIAIWVKRDSSGPLFHRRRVLGRGGKQFDALKFRSMYVDGDERLRQQPGALEALRKEHKLKRDPRVTTAGRWLRRYSLDELPQLFNVLRGQMSLVGPRMITAEETPRYGPKRMNLLSVKPGITGLWQVSGRSDLSYDERVRIDMYYVRNYSVWMDLQILFVQTLPAVLRGRGAY